MEGLIKGLVDVALGGGRDRDDREEEQRSRDERSRSSWAEVVSGDQDRDDQERRRHSQHNNQWSVQEESQFWQDEGSRPSRRPQKAVDKGHEKNEGFNWNQNNWNREEKREDNNDGWETVGRKPPRRQHKIQEEQWNGYKKPPNEQEYTNDVQIDDTLEPSEEELADLSQGCYRLWELDSNRLVPGKDYEIDCGDGKKAYQKDDMAQGSLFSWLSDDVFRKPTYSRFCSLLDNYNPNAGHKEVVTSEEKQEQAAFIEEISRTAPIKYLHKYLSAKGIVSGNYQDFKRTISSLWFDLYGRGGTSSCSSAFEHVFVGEIKQAGEQEVSGFHNWLQFCLEEAKGNVDYQGYIFPDVADKSRTLKRSC